MPATIHSLLPMGCKFHTPSYRQAFSLGSHPTINQVSKATRQWYDMAESEFIDIVRLNDDEAVAYRCRADGPRFVHKFSKNGCGSEFEGASEVSAKWRLLATWATVLLHAINLDSLLEGVNRQAKELRAQILCAKHMESHRQSCNGEIIEIHEHVRC